MVEQNMGKIPIICVGRTVPLSGSQIGRKDKTQPGLSTAEPFCPYAAELLLPDISGRTARGALASLAGLNQPTVGPERPRTIYDKSLMIRECISKRYGRLIKSPPKPRYS